MSRIMPTANTATFRVTITTRQRSGYEFSESYGPYATLGAAKAAVTRERFGRVVTAVRIERAELVWEDVTP